MYHVILTLELYKKVVFELPLVLIGGPGPSAPTFAYAGDVKIGNFVYCIKGLDKFWGAKHIQAPPFPTPLYYYIYIARVK